MGPARPGPSGRRIPESPDPLASHRWAWYGLSLLVPFAGILIGLLLYDQESRETRKLGRNCLFIGFLVWVVLPVLVLTALFLAGTLAVLSWISQAMPSAD